MSLSRLKRHLREVVFTEMTLVVGAMGDVTHGKTYISYLYTPVTVGA